MKSNVINFSFALLSILPPGHFTRLNVAINGNHASDSTQPVESQFFNSGLPHGMKRARNLTKKEYIPVEPIPGTNLYTGIYYTLGNKRFGTNAWVTWTEKKQVSNNWNYVQIDKTPDHQPNYKRDGSWYNDIQWVFIPSEVEGYYLLKNRGLPGNKVATWSRAEITDNDKGFHIVLAPDSDSESPGDHLWKPVRPSGVSDNDPFYQLRIQSAPTGTVTWTWKKYGDHSHYIQLDNGDPANYVNTGEAGNWWTDTLFSFKPIDTEFVAEVNQIEMRLFPKWGEIHKMTDIDCESVPATVFINMEPSPIVQKVNHAILGVGMLSVKLKPPFGNTKISDTSVGQVSPPWFASSVEFYKVSQQDDTINFATLERSEVNTEVTIPPWTTTEVRVCKEFINNTEVDVDVTVFMQISEKTYRPEKSGFKAEYANMPSSYAMKRLNEMLHSGDGGAPDIDPRWNMGPSKHFGEGGPAGDDLPVTVLGSREEDGDVVIVVPGTARGKFGFRGIVASN